MKMNPKLKTFGKTITFLPDATRGAVRNLTSQQLLDTKTENLVVNTLHLLIAPGPDKIQELGGVHEFMNWGGVMLSDSGGFQVFSLLHLNKWKGKIDDNGAIFKSPKDGSMYEITPESTIDIQMKLGTDILVVLDDCRKSSVDREQAEISVGRTLKWAQRSKDQFENIYGGTKKTGKILTAVVQGANFLDLREYCAKELAKIGFDGYNFGGYVLDDNGNLVKEEMKVVLENTPQDVFKYAMGVGKPEDIFEGAKIGYTVFDTVLPTRNARHGTLYSSSEEGGVVRIGNSKHSNDKSPIDKHCDCEACTKHTRAYVHHMLKVGEATGQTLATIHNLRFYSRLTEVLNNNRDGLKDMEYEDILELMTDEV